MKGIERKEQIKEFFETLWKSANEGYLTLFNGQDKRSYFFDLSKADAIPRIYEKAYQLSEVYDVYSSVGLLKEKPLGGRGKEKDIIGICGLWMDIDHKKGTHAKLNLPRHKKEANAFLRKFLEPSMIVSSGGGLHAYWRFNKGWYFEKLEEAKYLSQRFQRALIKRASDEHGWNLDSTSDLSRILRVAGTYNRKSDPLLVEIMRKSDKSYTPSEIEQYLDGIPSNPGSAFKADSSENNLLNIIEKCEFLKHCRDDAATLPYNDWWCMISTLALRGGARPLLHDLSRPHPGYDYDKTEKLILDAQDKQRGPMLCTTIREKTNFDCPEGGCGVASPAHLQNKTAGSKGTKPDWPVLKEKALYGVAGNFVRLATEDSEADPAAVLLTFLTRFGVECGSDVVFKVGDTDHYARLFTAIVGKTSRARKGTSASPVKNLFNFNGSIAIHYEPARHSPGPLSSGEGVVYAVRDQIDKLKKDETSKETILEVTDVGVKDKRLFVLDEEFAGALSAMKREGNTLSTILRTAFDTGNIEPLTKYNRIKATGAHIGIVTHCTLEELTKKFNHVDIFSGFANRFLWCCAERQGKVAFPKPITDEELERIQSEIIDIIDSVKSFSTITLSEESKEKWEIEYSKLTIEHPGLVGTTINRSEAQVIRLSMIYALLDKSDKIRPEHLDAALTVWQYCEDSAYYIFGDHRNNPTATKIMKALETSPKTATDLHRHFSGHLKKETLNDALGKLTTNNEIEEEKVESGGRPAIRYRIKEPSKKILV